jgi:hypothetical protein
VATDYIETDSSTASAGVFDDLPRIDYTSGSAQLLLEPSRTNKVPHSEYFEASDWNTVGTVTLDFGYEAPDGTNSAYKVSGTTSSALYLSGAGIVAGDTRSIWAKTVSGTGTVDLLTFNANTDNTFTVTNEWQRFELTGSPNAIGQTNIYAVDFRGSGNTLTELLLWGAQAEAGDFATSYIPTYGASDTRAQDQAEFDQDIASGAWTIYMDLENFTILSGTLKGSFFFKSLVSPSDSALFFNQSCFGWPNTSSGLSYSCDKLGASGTEFTGKWAATYDGVNTIKIYVDGSLKSTATNVDPNRASGISSGQLQYKGDHEPRKFINDLKIYSKELSQSEAEALTA